MQLPDTFPSVRVPNNTLFSHVDDALDEQERLIEVEAEYTHLLRVAAKPGFRADRIHFRIIRPENALPTGYNFVGWTLVPADFSGAL